MKTKETSYCVSGTWQQDGSITHVLLHELSTDGLTNGVKVSIAELTNLIRLGCTVRTIYWEYGEGNFYKGNFLQVQDNGTEAIVYSSNGKEAYDLERLPCLNMVTPGNEVPPLIQARQKQIKTNE